MTENTGNAHWAVSPLDGRYKSKLSGLGSRISEGALIVQRIRTELKWLWYLGKQTLAGRLDLPWRPEEREVALLRATLSEDFSGMTGKVKQSEAVTNHDVKAVEYVLRDYLREKGLGPSVLAMIHFPCTSEDINNLSYSLMLREVHQQDILPLCRKVLEDLAEKSDKFRNHAMLSRTHGQEATPTTLGKETAVFGYRLHQVYREMRDFVFTGKMNGAVGNYNAHLVVAPDADWEALSREFVEKELQLKWNPYTTQIESHDAVARWCRLLSEYQTISLGLCQDMWAYISLGYFRQKMLARETGSSTMPHKVNPIDFENAEGNFGLAVAMAGHFAGKLPVSRLQRDLSDSTTQRALGSMAGHFIIAQKSLLKGLGKVVPDPDKLSYDLKDRFELLAEPVQMVLRSYGVVNAYERLKEMSRGKQVTKEDIQRLISNCPELPQGARQRLSALSPCDYTGLAPELAARFAEELRADLRSGPL